MPADSTFVVSAEEVGETLAALVRRRGLATTWNEARKLVSTGKLSVDGRLETDPVSRPRAGASVALAMRARRVEPEVAGRLVHDDPQIVVFDKPAGVSSVPYEEREGGTAMDLIRAHWRRAGRSASDVPLHVVHRIDKDTSGLLAFAKTKTAERALGTLFRAHDIQRTYLCVVHGQLTDRRIESHFIEDRGDGLRGSIEARFARSPGLRQGPTGHPGQGKRAVTHVRAIEPIGRGAMLCEVRLETGKTHQIRIHLSENGHPLVGERVYIRDYVNGGAEPLPSPRLLLHAATLGFAHPHDGRPVQFESPMPMEFLAAIDALRRC